MGASESPTVSVGIREEGASDRRPCSVRQRCPGGGVTDPPPPLPAPSSRLAQLLPHAAEKSVLVVQTKDPNDPVS